MLLLDPYIPFQSFSVPICTWNIPLVSLICLKRFFWACLYYWFLINKNHVASWWLYLLYVKIFMWIMKRDSQNELEEERFQSQMLKLFCLWLNPCSGLWDKNKPSLESCFLHVQYLHLQQMQGLCWPNRLGNYLVMHSPPSWVSACLFR